MKRIRFESRVPAEVRTIDRENAMRILSALHHYAETGEGDVKSLQGDFAGMLRLRVGQYRLLFNETGDTITVHRIRDRRDAYKK